MIAILIFCQMVLLTACALKWNTQVKHNPTYKPILRLFTSYKPQRARILDGRKIAEEIQLEIRQGVDKLKAEKGVVPSIGVLLVGNNTQSHTYVRLKQKAAEKVGMKLHVSKFPAETEQNELVKTVQNMNSDPNIHGIIVQLPLPLHLQKGPILNAISPQKDIDGITSPNMGSLVLSRILTMKSLLETSDEEDALLQHNFHFVSPCTPSGIMELLQRSEVVLFGKHVVVLGTSIIAGLPIGLMCIHRNSTVSFCHSHTKYEDMVRLLGIADIVICAVGKPHFIKKEWLKEGAVVVDVGINPIPDPTRRSGYRIVGDVDYDVREVASAITPVPGGVGPMTVTMLLKNALQSAKRQAYCIPPDQTLQES